MRKLMGGAVSRLLGIVLSVSLGVGPALQSVPAFASESEPAAESQAGEGAAVGAPTVVRELVEDRTATARHYLLSDGTKRAEIFDAPIHYQDEGGDWTEIDPSLVPTTTPGEVVTKSTPATSRFRSQTSTRKPVRLEGKRFSAEIDMLGVAEDAKLVYGNKVRYLGVDRQTDLEYEALANGLKETVVLNSAEAPSRFSFELALDGASVVSAPGGGNLLVDSDGNKVGEIGQLLVTDSSASRVEGTCDDATMTVQATATGAIITYEISRDWLDSPDRVFPVLVDPTIYDTDSTVCPDTFVAQAHPTTSYYTSNWLSCGYVSGWCESYVKFTLASIPAGSYINDAQFKVYQYTGDSGGVNVGRLTSSFGSSTTYNNKPTKSYLAQPSLAGSTGWITQEVGPTVQDWVDGTTTNYGLALYQNSSSYYREFRAGEYGTTSYRPRLVVNYDTPYTTVAGYTSVYKLGDTVTVEVKARTPYYSAVNDIRLLLNYNNGNPRRGYLRWSKTNTDPHTSGTWSYSAASTGYFSTNTNTSYGGDKIEFLPAESTYGTGTDYKRATFKFRVKDDFGDIQANDFDARLYMDSAWSPGWETNDTNVNILPKPVTSPSHTRSSSDWFREVDRDNDGRADTANDKPDQGRGAVSLTWPASPLADGYRIYAYDGGAYQKVGETIGNGATSWSSTGARIFPKDSDYTGRADNSWAENPFAGAQSPASATKQASVTVPDGGAGVVVTDGSYLYYRAWSTYPGPTKWRKVGSGLNGTTVGEDKGYVGPDLASKRILSAFSQDGVIYNGYALTPTTIEGVPLSAADGQTETRTLTFSQALLDRTSGSSVTGASGNVLLAATDERIYSASYNLTAGDTKDGFRIREYDRDGAFIADHDVAVPSYLTDGLLADGTNLYLVQWGSPYKVTKISTSGWKVTGQWEAGWSATREINGCYDSANEVFWLGALDQNKVHRFAGPGLDLRDSPNELYKKTDSTTYDTYTNYWFRVVPYSEIGELAVGDNTATLPTLDNRTVRVNDDPRHTSYDLGQIRGHQAEALLDQGSLALSIDDLSISSWGPSAALRRHYDSKSAAASAWAPGWVFNFEQRIEGTGNLRDYIDESGEAHRYTLNTTTSTWAAPNGDYSALEADGSGWKITTKDRSVLRFDSAGRITSEDDRNGNRVEYNWNQARTELRVKAANGQEIIANFTSSGCITDASYSVSDSRVPAENRVRKIEYNYGDGYSGGSINIVRWFPNSEVTEDPDYDPFTSPWNQAVSYHYDGSDRLERIWDSHFVTQSIWGAQWDFAYDEQAGELALVVWPGDDLGWPRYAEGNGRRAELAYDAPARTATITSIAEVAGQEQSVAQRYVWNPTGTEVSHTNKVIQLDASSPKWIYTYSPQNEQASEQSPVGITTRSDYDSRGNLIRSFDGKGGLTRNVYDSSDNLVRTTTPAGRTSYMTYDAVGNTLSEERVLTVAGERSRTEYTYDTQGRGILVSERRRVSQAPDVWAQTDYIESSIAPNGEAQTVIDRGVKLSAASSAVDLTKTKEYDDFGNLLWEKDAAGQWATKSSDYDVSGRQVASEDASGTTTRTIYDKLGYVAETWREHGGVWVDRKKNENTADGQTYRETYLKHGSDGAAVTDRVVEHVIDPAGNVVEQQSSAGTTEVQYNAQGLATSQLDPGTTEAGTADYDDDGRLTDSTAPGNTEADETDYDEGGNVVEEDPAGADATTFDYDADGNQTLTSEPTDAGGVAQSASIYDVGGRLTKSADAKGFVTTFSYDQLDRQLAAISGGASATKVYNTLGWVLSETDLDGQTKTYQYDEAGRVTSETLSGQTTTTVYDGMGRIVCKTKPDGSTVGYVYDEFGRMVTETHTRPGAGEPVRAIERTFDDEGRELSSTDSVRGISSSSIWSGEAKASMSRAAGETTVTVEYDDQGREDALSSTNGTGSVSRQLASRDAAGKVTALALDAGTPLTQQFSYESTASKLIGQDGMGLGSAGIDYEYNSHTARQTREKIDLAYPVVAADRDRGFAYDDAGRLTSSMDVGSAAVSFTYQPDGRITAAGGRTFTYRSEPTRTQQLLSMTEGSVTTTFGFDSRGRRSGFVSQEESATYDYNDDDRLVSFAKDLGKDGSLDVTATYAYDAEGQRTRSVVTSGGVTTMTDWTYEGLTLLRSVAVTNEETTTVEYVNDEAGRPVGAWVSVPGRTAPEYVWVVTDARGDVLELLASDGTPLSYRVYSAYGERTSTASRAVGSVTATQAAAIDDSVRLRFAGYAFDAESGLYYCSQRYYDPVTCQWISRDPARADGEESAYQYCGGDPVGKVDPNGERYNGSAAAGYANLYAQSWNSKYAYYWGGDCTNFVSQALRAGGLSYDWSGTRKWWWRAKRDHSRSWSVAHELYQWLDSTHIYVGRYSARSGYNYPYYSNRSFAKGDVVFYDWTGDGHIDHAAIVTSKWYSVEGPYGWLVAQHTSPTANKNSIWNRRARLEKKGLWKKTVFRVFRPR